MRALFRFSYLATGHIVLFADDSVKDAIISGGCRRASRQHGGVLLEWPPGMHNHSCGIVCMFIFNEHEHARIPILKKTWPLSLIQLLPRALAIAWKTSVITEGKFTPSES